MGEGGKEGGEWWGLVGGGAGEREKERMEES